MLFIYSYYIFTQMNKYLEFLNMSIAKEKKENVIYVKPGERFNGYSYDEIIKMDKEFVCRMPAMVKSKYCNLVINRSVEETENFGTSVDNHLSEKSEESPKDEHQNICTPCSIGNIKIDI